MINSKTHWKTLYSPSFMGSFSFAENERKTLRIASVEVDMVPNKKGEEEECVIVHWHAVDHQLPLILNKINAEAIAKAVGSQYLEDWISSYVTLTVQNVRAFGDVVPAVRVSPTQPDTADRMAFLRKRYQQVRTTLDAEEAKKIDADLAQKNKASELTPEYIEQILEHIDSMTIHTQ